MKSLTWWLTWRNEFIPNNLSFFLSPVFILRYWLYRSIQKYSKKLYWNVMDFWCWAKPYRDLFSNVENYIWLDIEASWHDHRSSKIDVFYDWNKIPFDDNHFDWVFTSEVLEHVFNLDDMLIEIHRVLKKDWTLFLTIPFCIWEHEAPYDFGRYTSFWIRAILEKRWFTIIEHEKVNTYFQTIINFIVCFISESLTTQNKFLNIILLFIKLPLYVILNFIGYIFPIWSQSVFTNQIILAVKN